MKNKVYLKKENSNGISCENMGGIRCHFSGDGCKNPILSKKRNYCLGKTFTKVTILEFLHTKGKKYQVKKNGSVFKMPTGQWETPPGWKPSDDRLTLLGVG